MTSAFEESTPAAVPACIVFYISGHGLGHAARQIEVINAVTRVRPDVRIIARTAAPRWLFDLTLTRPAGFFSVECDTGVVQVDSLHVDERETVKRAAEFHAALDERSRAEAAFLTGAHADLVVGDIPPLAFSAAERAGVPSIAIGNFGWDWIYAGYPELVQTEPALLPVLRRAYRGASLTLRLPLSGGMEACGGGRRDIPFIARRSTRTRADVRGRLGISDARPVVLLSFGGYGLSGFDERRLGQMTRFLFVTTVNPDGGAEPPSDRLPTNVLRLDERELYQSGYRYEDLVAVADVIATKPGYGIISEAVANRTAILFTSRGRFAEYDMLVAAMPQIVRSRFIDHAALFAGAWGDSLDRLLAQPPPPGRPATDGAEVSATIVLDYLQ